MKASLTGAVSLFAAPLAQTARLVEALRQKAAEDPSILRGGAGTPAPAEPATDAAPEASTIEASTVEASTVEASTVGASTVGAITVEATEASGEPDSTEAAESDSTETTESESTETTEG